MNCLPNRPSQGNALGYQEFAWTAMLLRQATPEEISDLPGRYWLVNEFPRQSTFLV